MYIVYLQQAPFSLIYFVHRCVKACFNAALFINDRALHFDSTIVQGFQL